MNAVNILICDDDKEIVRAISVYLENEGYQVFKAYNGIEAIELVRDQVIHLIIMDIMMPKMDGITATMKIRQDNMIPLIMLSAKSEDYDKILGLNIGADDYMGKPFNPLELVARVKSLLRRYTAFGSLEVSSNIFQTGGLMIDDEKKVITVDNQAVHLTPVQYKILKLLTANTGEYSQSKRFMKRYGMKVPLIQKIRWRYIFGKFERKLKLIRKSRSI